MKKGLLILISVLIFECTQAQVSFAPAVNYTTLVAGPSAITSADFNGDGIKDLAVGSGIFPFPFGAGVSILLGSGTGSFTPFINYPISGAIVFTIISKDFNMDGKADLAISCGVTNAAILLGNGNGTFSVPFFYSLSPSTLHGVVSDDLNGDGKLDLATANTGGGALSILIGNNTGNFNLISTYSAGSSGLPTSIISGDFNSDGINDLATSIFVGNVISVLFGSGNGVFGTAVTYSVGSSSQSLITSDFNLDGRADIATANPGGNNVSILLGNTSGTFAPAVNYSVGAIPQYLTNADFNLDGKMDIAVANSNSNNVSVLLGTGLGTFSPAINFSVGQYPFGITATDFNGDGKPDIAVTNQNGNDISVLLNTLVLSPAETLDLDGINDYISMPPTMLSSLTEGTMESWVYLNSNTDEVLCIKPHLTGNMYAAFSVGSYCDINGTKQTGTPGKLYFHSANGVIEAGSSSNLSTGQWYHIAVTFNSSQVKFYINGVLDNTVSGNYSIPIDLIFANVSLGGWTAGASYMSGKLDEVRIWNRVLCISEIQNNMNGEIASTANGLIANYHFNQGYNALNNMLVTNLADASGSTYNGTLINVALTGSVSNWVAPSSVSSGSLVPIFAGPAVNATTSASLICNGQSATLSASGAANYSWTPSIPLSGIISPTTNTTYTVNGMDINGCSNKALVTQSVSGCTNVTALDQSDIVLINFYPNPSDGVYIIDTDYSLKVTIINLLGEIVFSQNINKGENKIDLTSFSNGVYTLSAQRNEQIKNFKLIKH